MIRDGIFPVNELPGSADNFDEALANRCYDTGFEDVYDSFKITLPPQILQNFTNGFCLD